jgi:hypothetical protein
MSSRSGGARVAAVSFGGSDAGSDTEEGDGGGDGASRLAVASAAASAAAPSARSRLPWAGGVTPHRRPALFALLPLTPFQRRNTATITMVVALLRPLRLTITTRPGIRRCRLM